MTTRTTVERRSWQQMRDQHARLLLRRTGKGVDEWNRLVADQDPADERSLRGWLARRGVTGYSQQLLVFERFGYPEFFKADVDQLVAGQYSDRPGLRPVCDAILGYVSNLGQVAIQARKTYISLVSTRRTFAVVQATTRSRVDLGLRLRDAAPGGRLEPGKGVGNGTMSVKITLTAPRDFDAEARAWLLQAHEENR